MTNVQKVAQQFQLVGAPTIRERLRFALIPLCGVSGSNQEIRELTTQLVTATHPQAKEEALNRLIASVEYRLQGSGLTQKQIGTILKAHLRASSVKDSQGFSSSALIDQRYRITFLDRHADQIGAAALTTAAALYAFYTTTQLAVLPIAGEDKGVASPGREEFIDRVITMICSPSARRCVLFCLAGAVLKASYSSPVRDESSRTRWVVRVIGMGGMLYTTSTEVALRL